MKPHEKIEELIKTRINGNNIKNNKTYLNMINSLRTPDFIEFEKDFFGEVKSLWIYKKIDKIEFYKDLLTKMER